MAYYKLQQLSDVGRSYTAKAAGTISGGDLVQWVSGGNSVNSIGSTNSTLGFGDILAIQNTDTTGEQCLGIALFTTTSGNEIAIATQGIFVLPVGSNGVSGAMPVISIGYANCVERCPTGSVALRVQPIGRALNAGTANGQFVVVKLNI